MSAKNLRMGFAAALMLALSAIVSSSQVTAQSPAARDVVSFSDFVRELAKEPPSQVQIRSQTIVYTRKDGRSAMTVVPSTAMLAPIVDKLIESGSRVHVREAFSDDAPSATDMFINWLPAILIFGSAFYLIGRSIRQLRVAIQDQNNAIKELVASLKNQQK